MSCLRPMRMCAMHVCVCVLCTVVIIAVLLHQIPSGTPFSCCSVDLWYFFFLVGVCVLARRAVFVRKSRIESPSECALHGTWSPNDRFGYLILSTFLSTTLFAKTYTALHDLISRKGIRLLSKREYKHIVVIQSMFSLHVLGAAQCTKHYKDFAFSITYK